jgi:hypothetical protein
MMAQSSGAIMDRAWLLLFLTAAFLIGSGFEAKTESTLRLRVPVECEVGKTCFIQNLVDHDPGSGASDYMCGSLTYDRHNGTDFRVPDLPSAKSVNVLAAASGRVLRVRDGMPDVSIRETGMEAVKGKECGNAVVIGHDGGWETQYCHMAQGSVVVHPGDKVTAGQAIGRVGLSGETEFPHLHLTVLRQGKVIDPFAVNLPAGKCGPGESLWDQPFESEVAYKPDFIINTGFASGKVTNDEIEHGVLRDFRLDNNAPALVAVVRAGGLRKGDVLELALYSPQGDALATKKSDPLPAPFAQYVMLIGRKRPASGWSEGVYHAGFRIVRDGTTFTEARFQTRY